MIDPDEATKAYVTLLAAVHAHRETLERDLLRRNDALVTVRQESLRSGLDVRRSRLELLSTRPGLDERIRRMRRAQIANLEQRTHAEIDALEQQRSVRVGFKVVAGGLADFVP